MFKQFGAPELILVVLIIVLLFGAKKLPDAARGLGRSLRIFKAETKGLGDDDTPPTTPDAAAPSAVAPAAAPGAVEGQQPVPPPPGAAAPSAPVTGERTDN